MLFEYLSGYLLFEYLVIFKFTGEFLLFLYS